MRNYINALKGLFKRTDKEEVSPVRPYVKDEDLSCLVTIRIDTTTGDFNVTVDPKDTTPEAASVLGLLMYLLNSGKLSNFFVDSYEFWSKDDPTRTSFTEGVMQQWLSSAHLYEGEPRDDLAIKASDVFSTKG